MSAKLGRKKEEMAESIIIWDLCQPVLCFKGRVLSISVSSKECTNVYNKICCIISCSQWMNIYVFPPLISSYTFSTHLCFFICICFTHEFKHTRRVCVVSNQVRDTHYENNTKWLIKTWHLRKCQVSFTINNRQSLHRLILFPPF